MEAGPVNGERNFDVDFWQAQSAEARFAAAWDLVKLAHEAKGLDLNELRLQRPHWTVKPIRG